MNHLAGGVRQSYRLNILRYRERIPNIHEFLRYQTTKTSKKKDTQSTHIQESNEYNDLSESLYQRGNIFQNSKFESLTLSDDGSLLQNEINDKNRNNYDDMEESDEHFDEFSEDGLNVDLNYVNNLLKMKEHEESKSDNLEIQKLFHEDNINKNDGNLKQHDKSSEHALKMNPCEDPVIKLTRTNFLKAKYKLDKNKNCEKEYSLDDFYGKVVKDKTKSIDFTFEVPQFPKHVNKENLYEYLKNVNSINLNYDLNNAGKTIHAQMNNLVHNILKLEGILDVNTMHEFLKFYLESRNNKVIFLLLFRFEKMNIIPTKDTLHLLIYESRKIRDKFVRKRIVERYIQMGIKKWEIPTDVVTKTLICISQNSSKKRLSMLKALVNEGLVYKDVKWQICEDYTTIEFSEKNKKFTFDRFSKYLVRKKIIDDSREDKIEAFKIYIKNCVHYRLDGITFRELRKYEELVTKETWILFIEGLLNDGKIWKCIATFNYICKQKKYEKKELAIIAFSLMNRYKAIHKHLARKARMGKLELINESKMSVDDLYSRIMKNIANKVKLRFAFVDEYLSTLLISSDEQMDLIVKEKYKNIILSKKFTDKSKDFDINQIPPQLSLEKGSITF